MAKHLINQSEDWARESIQGFLLSNNSNLIALEEHPNVIVRKDYLSLESTNSRVALISGGGSGHEPAHLGFVGHGMLTAVVCGDLFASPSVASILSAIRFVGSHNKAGVLMIVKNYTGDRLNFGMAAKQAQLEGIKVDWILVDDDIALINDASSDEFQKDNSVGRRGLCGTLFVHKIAGALAEQRKTLKEIKDILKDILDDGKSLRTIGVSLSGRVQLPDTEINQLDSAGLGSDIIEIGLGIHGESGRHKMKLTKSAELVESVLSEYLFRGKNESNEICIMINNLGGLSNLELYLLVNDSLKYIHARKSDLGQVKRLYTGTLMTSLNMNGFSISVLRLKLNNSAMILELLDQNTNAPAWPKTCGRDVVPFEYTKSSISTDAMSFSCSIDKENYIRVDSRYSNMLKFFLKTIAEDLISTKQFLNDLDSGCGDGDCGNSMAKVSESLLKNLENNTFEFRYPHEILLGCANILKSCGGTLAILLALFCTSAANAFRKSESTSKTTENLDFIELWAKSLRYGIDAVQEYGRVKPGERSIIDPLVSLSNYLNNYIGMNGSDRLEEKILLKNLVDVTYEAAQTTAKMKPRVGRASYVDSATIKTPDAGALAISSIISSLYKAFIIFVNNE